MELSQRLNKLMLTYNLEAKDIAYCDLVLSGWLKHEAAFYAYGLALPEKSKINLYIKEYTKNHPGIEQYLSDAEKEKMEQSVKAERLKTIEAQKRAKAEMEAARASAANVNNETTDVLEKDDLLKLYSEIIRDPLADAKTKMDAAKGLSDLTQMKKEVAQVEDNRTHFFLPLSCHKCELYMNFQKLKQDERTDKQK
ncbi:MAG: hypothetical protein KBT03_11000 [Bacteroidales bacterium]|nr:hypothetical protein [Candidatus Scybalousia scybalohippi]